MKKNKKKANRNVTSNTQNKTASSTNKTTVVSNYYGSSYKTYKPVYTYKGRRNETEFPEFVELCKKTQEELIDFLPKELMEAGYSDVVVGEGYIYAKGSIPVLLTAHMDTVHKSSVEVFYEYVNEKGHHVLASPQGIGGDDRCGVYMILDIIKEHKCSVLFCEDEEIGGIGSRNFCKTKFIDDLSNMKYMIELDRANANDAVFYDCDNPEFTKFIEDNTGYKETYGTFSDISNLAPACGVAAVNFSCGYYHAHTLGEEVVVEEMLNTIKVVKHLLTVECEQFEFIEATYSYGYYGYYGKGYGSYYDYDDYDDYTPKKTTSAVKGKYDWYDKDPTIVLYVTFYDGFYEEHTETYCSTTENGAWLKFFKDNPDTSWNMVLDYEFDYA